eukprot:TRINITY_DN31314_c0_g1_i1.p1 TRINITY_DN31314_c0_g1~~TRINITY_DN31314_c0_g1_i1.p1  ORF type:complete len:219 (-),score=46.74 TRINITY_DN31314_c0_g1_i1:178-834(-)
METGSAVNNESVLSHFGDINSRFFQMNEGSEYLEKFEVESREIFVHREKIVAALKLQPGMRVVDIGAGTGLFLSLLSAAVQPGGHLTCTDIAPKFVEFLERRRADLGLSADDVDVVLTGHTDLPLKSPVDVALLSDAYHHIEYPAAFVSAVRSALRPGGSFVVIDYERIEGVSSPWIMGHVRADKQTVISEITSHGFRLAEEVTGLLTENYFLRFEVC